MTSRYAEHGWHEGDAKRMIETNSSGTALELLTELKARIVAKIADPTVAARDLASLSARLLDVSKAIREVKALGDEDDDWLEQIRAMPAEPWDESKI